MIKINLTNEEAATLSEVLSRYLSDLRMEIANTDSMDFREKLKDRECLLKKVIEELDSTLG